MDRMLIRTLLQTPRRAVPHQRTIQLNRTLATPIPHPTLSAHPPPAPSPPDSSTNDRLNRKREHAQKLAEGIRQTSEPSKPNSTLKKRFWKHVSVQETPNGFQIHLDTRPVRLPSKAILHIPHTKPGLATALALEWDSLNDARQALKTHYIPLTSLVSRAVDIAAQDAAGQSSIRDEISALALRHLHTDTLLCWDPEPEHGADEARGSLRAMQIRTARPILAALTSRVWPGVELRPALAEDSISPAEQPEVTREVVRGWVRGLPSWELAALERGVVAGKSLCVAARLVAEWSATLEMGDEEGEECFGVEKAAEACSLEVKWQTGRWGEVEDTHDVDREDLRRQLGSVVLLVSGEKE